MSPGTREVVLYALGALALLAGLAGTVLPAIPGAVLLVAGAFLVAWAEHFTRVPGWIVAVAAGIGALIWIVDLAAGALGAKRFGASRWAVAGSTVGALVGLTLGPVGLLLGPAVGAVVFEYLWDPDLRQALRSGVGAFLGFVLGSAVKIALAFVLVAVVVGAVIW